MFKDEQFDTNGHIMIARKQALIDLAAIAVRLTREQLIDSQNKIANEIEQACRCKREDDVHGEYIHNCHANTESKRIVQYAKDYQQAIDAYFHLRMIDSQGENRELQLVD